MNEPEIRMQNSAAQKRYWKNNDRAREIRSQTSKRIMNTPGMKDFVRSRTREAMQRPDVVANLRKSLAIPEVKHRMRVGIINAWKNPETQERHSRAMLTDLKRTGRCFSVEMVRDETDEVINTFDSISQAARKTNTPKSTLLKRLKDGKSSNGFSWRRV